MFNGSAILAFFSAPSPRWTHIIKGELLRNAIKNQCQLFREFSIENAEIMENCPEQRGFSIEKRLIRAIVYEYMYTVVHYHDIITHDIINTAIRSF